MTSRRLPYGPIDQQALTRFERELPGPLPQELKQFLLESNGADIPDAREIEEVPGGARLQEIYGLHAGPAYLRLDHMFHQFDGVPESVLVFAADAYGNYFGIALSGTDTGAVYFIDHETLPAARETLIRVADSFSGFLSRSECNFDDEAPAATTVLEAIDSGDHEALQQLLAAGGDASGAVHRAVHRGDLRILETVLQQGGDPNERGAIGGTETPLFVAARRGRADMTKALLDFGADPTLRCGAGGTTLQMAKPWPEVTEVLRKAGARS